MATLLLPAGPGHGAWHVAALVMVTALPVLLGTRRLLAALPEPAEPDGKPPYASLATPRFVGTCTVLAAFAAVLAGLTVPAATWPLWWVLGAPGLVLVAVDAETTWLPLPLTRLAWVAGLGAMGTTAALAGFVTLGRAAAGATVAWLLYLLLWRLSGRRIGFGDVRFAPLLGAAAAAVGWPTLLATLLLGSLVGAGVGVVLALRRRTGAFAYAPSMLLGAYLACAVRLVSG